MVTVSKEKKQFLIEITTEITDEKWQELLGKVPVPTFFHTKKWLEILTNSFENCVDHSQLYVFEDGTEVLFPLVKFPYLKSMMNSYFSSYTGVYGGLVSPKTIDQEKVKAIINKFFNADTAGIYVYHSPFMKLACPGRFKKQTCFTHMLNLRNDFDHIWEKKFSGNQRSKIRRAEKKGVRVIEGKTEEDIRSFYSLYEKSIKRWGDKTTWARPYEFCNNSVILGQGNTKFKLALLDDKIIAGAITHYFGNHMYYAWGAFDHDYRAYYPNNLIFKELIKEACQDGIKYYDMGASAGLKGVTEFKESFGAVSTSYDAYVWENPLYKIYKKVRKVI